MHDDNVLRHSEDAERDRQGAGYRRRCEAQFGARGSPKEWITKTRGTQIVEILMKQDAGTALKRAEGRVMQSQI